MELSNKEKFIKKTLENQSHVLDKDALWQSVQPHLVSNDSRKGIFWFVFSGVILLFLSVSGYRFFDLHRLSTQEIVYQNDIVTPVESTSIAVPPGKTPNGNNITESTIINTEIVTKANTHEFESTTNQSIALDHELNTKKHSNRNLSKPNESINIETNEKLLIDKEHSRKNKNPDLSGSISQALFTQAGAHAEEEDKKYSVPRTEALPALTNIRISEISDLSSLDRPVLSEDFIQPIQVNPKNYFVTLRFGMNSSLIRNEINTQDVFISTNEFSHEKSMPSFTGDVLFGRELKNGWNLFGGLTYNQNVIRYLNTEIILESGQVNGIQSTYESRDGTVTTTQGLTNQNTLTSYDVRWFRKHRSLMLSAGIGKDLIRFNRISLSADVAINYILSSAHQGYYFSNSPTAFTKFEDGEEHIYNGNAKLLLRGGLGINYSLDHLSIGMHSFYIYNQNSLTGKNNFYQTGISTIGIQLGLTYYPRW
ncbi:MAG: hypothetical protein HKN67_10060 [Saprospiraceae bacterium]|nr:hypothetical protein [Saprospiraceae bacterium]